MVSSPTDTTRPSALMRSVNAVIGAAIVLAAVLHIALVGFLSLRAEGKFTPDSAFYIDGANNVLAGRGLSSSMIELPRAILNETTLPRPLTVWGPVYPLLIAALGTLGWSTPAAALILSAVFYGASLVAMAFLVGRLAGWGASAFVVALAVHFGDYTTAAMTAWSETTGLSFLLLALLFTVKSADHDHERLVYFLGAGVFAGLAIATRYALAPIALIVFVGVYRNSPTLSRTRRGFCIGVPLLLTVGSILLRNTAYTGRLGGDRLEGPSSTMGAVTRQTIDAFAATGQSFSYPAYLGVVIGIAVGLGWWAIMGRRRAPVSNPSSLPLGYVALLLWPATYLAFLVFAQGNVRLDVIDGRLLLPLTVVLGPTLIAKGLRAMRIPAVWPASIAIVLLVIAIAGNVPLARAISRAAPPPPHEFQTRIAHSPLLAWLDKHATRADLLIAENGMDLPLYLGPINTLFFRAEPVRETINWDSTVRHLLETRACERYDTIYVVVGDEPVEDENGVLERLHVGTVDVMGLTEIAHPEGARVYRVACDRLPKL